MKFFRTYVVWLVLGLGLVTSCVVAEREGPSVGSSLDSLDESLNGAWVEVCFRVEPEGVYGEHEGDSEQGYGGRSIVNPGVDTNEGTGAGYVPLDVWMIQYGGVGDDAPMVGRPQYVDLETEQGGAGSAQVQAAASSAPNTLIFVANTHDSNIEWGDIDTPAKFKQTRRTITREKDCYGSNLHPGGDLIMSGKYEGVIDNRAISVALSRSIARLDLTLRNGAASGLTLRSVQLCNVPGGLCYAGSLAGGGVVVAQPGEFFDYPQELLDQAGAEGSSQSFTFYLPSNERGVSAASTSSQTKSAHAPAFATYLRIMALDQHGTAYAYKVYPGANTSSDYNLLPNHRYTLELLINSPGDASTDSRVENYGRQDFETSNCYILNPAPEGASPRVFTIPVARANEFWGDLDPALTLGPGDAWTVELIWQDTSEADFIRFVELPGGTLTTTSGGTGPNGRFAVTTSAGYHGNALVGIRKVGHEDVGYLWSWHLWVTDYNPRSQAVAVAGQRIYPVDGGVLHRYAGPAWDSPTGRYSNKYMMDRNIGSRSTLRNPIGALYYQWGRKDPLPGELQGNQLYDIQGQPLSSSDPRNAAHVNKNAGLGVTLATGVLNPTAFYYKAASSGVGDWTNQGRVGDHVWNNPVKGLHLKSIFDPCPQGWCLPLAEAFDDFSYTSSDPLACTVLSAVRHPNLGWWHQGVPGLRYWPLDSTPKGEIYIQTLGYRYKSSGVQSYIEYAYLWFGTATRGMSCSSVAYQVGYGGDRSSGFPARCVQQ